MKRETAALCLSALVTLLCVADTHAYFCRYSSYQVNPKVLFSIKKQIIGACGFKVVTGKPKGHKDIALSKAIVENPRAPRAKQCSSIKLTTLAKPDWNTFKACQDAHPKWPTLFAKRSQCSQYQKSVPC